MIDKLNTHYSMTNPASVYDEESLTALELAGRTTAKVNEVVESQNNHMEETKQHLNAQDKDIENQKTVVIPATIQREVQKYINNGGFDKAIDLYAGELEKRLNNLLGTVSEGSTTGDAELIDGRVDYKGNTHTNIGEHIREVSSQLSGEIATKAFLVNNPSTIENSEMLSDFNTAKPNRYYIINTTDILNMPIAEKGVLLTFYRISEMINGGGHLQLYFTEKNKMYFRISKFVTTLKWLDWENLADLKDLADLKKMINNCFTGDSTMHTVDSLTDFNNACGNRLYCVNNPENIISMPISKKGALLTFYRNGNDLPQAGGDSQFFITSNGEIHFRNTRFASGVQWNDWKKISFEKNEPIYHNGTSISTFNKILCIGDSLTEGVSDHNENGTNVNNTVFKKYSYPTQLEKLTGVECSNYGSAGVSTKSWYEKYENTDFVGHDCAIIVLGTNDYARGISLDDSDYYLRNIINKIKAENKGIKIFISSILAGYYKNANGDTLSYYTGLNAMRKTTADELNDCFFVDMATYGRAHGSYYTQGHPTAIGYNQIAEDFKNYISYIIDNNSNEFRNVQFIGTDYNYS